ncbi:MAG: radical SAM family heme chaperone HemW [Planctomycetota bacterium]|jgi:oxygen-independent coproporphyrinogen-3 oxidase
MSDPSRKENRKSSAPRPAPQDSAPSGGALYIHVPFCVRKCRYCNFYSIPVSEGPAESYLKAAEAELRAWADSLVLPLRSVFVGGGTPTALGSELLRALLSLVSELIDAATEFTVEANPGMLDGRIGHALAAQGVNRVKLGVQSFNAKELKVLGRLHSPGQVAQAAALLRKVGITNLGMDLIYGIPGQTAASWSFSLRQALQLAPAHLSCYALSFEPGTPLQADLRAGRVAEMSDSRQKACYQAAMEAAAAAGMEHYEISNFARPALRCLHNLTYWRNEPYLGIGPAAASYVAGVRRKNLPDLEEYTTALLNGHLPPATTEELTGRAGMAETLMLGLRLIEGIDRNDFRRRFGEDPVEAFPRSIGRYAEIGALIVSTSRVRLAKEHLFVADAILADIIGEA